MKRLLVLALLLASNAFATTGPEVCGNGFDDAASGYTKGACPAGWHDAKWSTGCDKDCPSPDPINFGYTTDGSYGGMGTYSKACSASDPTILPLSYVATGCSTGYHHQCQINGSYTGCTNTTLCEATGSGVCKYIDCAAGSDTTGNGTYGTPWKSLGMISGGAGGTVPAGAYTLHSGDVVYLLGAGSCTTAFTDGNYYPYSTLASLTASGDASHPITIKRYPGSTSTLVKTGGGMALRIQTGDYYLFEDLDIQCTGGESCIYSYGNNLEVRRSYIHDSNGNGDNNFACLYSAQVARNYWHHNAFKDCNRGSGNVNNVAAMTVVNDHTSSPGADHKLLYKSIVWTTDNISSQVAGGAINFKHNQWANESGQGLIIAHNTIVQPYLGLRWGTSKMRAYNNRFINPGTAFQININSSADRFQDNQFTYNTIYKSFDEGISSGFLAVWDGAANTGDENFTAKYNIIYNKFTSPNGSDGWVRYGTYLSDADGAIWDTNNYVVQDRNCYYNPLSSALPFDWFYATSGCADGVCSGYGSQYAFADWQGTKLQDVHGYLEDPVLDANLIATSSHCLSWGWNAQINLPSVSGICGW